MKEIFKTMNDMVEKTWTLENLGTWIVFFYGVITCSVGEWWYTLSARTISDFADACAFTFPGGLFIVIGTYILMSEYYARKRDEEA